MKNLKVAIIYYSATGTNHLLAKQAEETAKKAGAEEVRLRKIKEIAPEEAIKQNEDWAKHVKAAKDVKEVSLDDLEWADVFIFSVPTRYGNVPSQVSSFIDTTGGLWSQGKLANKVVTGMTSAQNVHGGQETTLLSLYKTMYHWGAIVVAPGYTSEVLFESGGNPYGLSVQPITDKMDEKVKNAVVHQVERTLTIASYIKKGLNAG